MVMLGYCSSCLFGTLVGRVNYQELTWAQLNSNVKVRVLADVRLVLSASDVDWRRLVFEAASSKGLHKWMAKRSWLLHGKGSEWNVDILWLKKWTHF